MRILLINPPLYGGPQFPVPGAVREKSADLPLGLLYLSAALKRCGFSDIEVIDFQAQGKTPDEAVKIIASAKPDLLGITVYSFGCYDVHRIVTRVRQALPHTHVTVGGPHAGLYPREILDAGWADSVCLGFGEQPIVELAAALQNGTTLEGIAGLAFRNGNRIHLTPASCNIKDIDAIPFPDRSGLDPAKQLSPMVDRPMPATGIITSRGCPHGCVFCAQSHTPYAQRSVANVLEEVRQCAEQGFEMINFEDDALNNRRSWIEAFCDGMMRMPTPIKWAFRGRVARFDEKLAKLCARAGCVRINFGVESGDDGMLTQIEKGITREQAKIAVGAAKSAGIATVTYYILGFPHETAEQMQRTIDFSLELRSDFAQFSLLVLMPGSALYDREKQLRGEGYDPFRDYTLQPTLDFRVPQPSDTLPRKQIIDAVRHAYRRYYFTPSFLFSGKGASGGVIRGMRTGASLLSYVMFGPKGW